MPIGSTTCTVLSGGTFQSFCSMLLVIILHLRKQRAWWRHLLGGCEGIITLSVSGGWEGIITLSPSGGSEGMWYSSTGTVFFPLFFLISLRGEMRFRIMCINNVSFMGSTYLTFCFLLLPRLPTLIPTFHLQSLHLFRHFSFTQ